MKIDLFAYLCTMFALGWLLGWRTPTLNKLASAWIRGLRERWSHGAPRSALPPYFPDMHIGPLF